MESTLEFVVFADDWAEHPSSCQHLFRRIARNHRTLWVNTIGLRGPHLSLADARRAMRKISRWFAPRDRTRNEDRLQLTVIAPPLLPWSRPAPVRAFQRAVLRQSVKRACEQLGFDHPILVTTLPNAVDVCGAINERRVVYYCVDDFTLWPDIDASTARTMEGELLDRADVVIATSESLRATRTRHGLVPRLLPHGVDVEHFARASDAETIPWPGVREGRPVLGSLGLIDERIDATLLAAIARLHPEWDIVLVGPVDRPTSSLRRIPNLRILPAVRYDDVPRVLAAFDVAILPYARNALTASINPLKLREYVASGLPVVATALPEVLALGDLVRVADTPETFAAACAAAMIRPRDQRTDRLLGESWDARAATFLAYCTDRETISHEELRA